jgi:hypothetical protein
MENTISTGSHIEFSETRLIASPETMKLKPVFMASLDKNPAIIYIGEDEFKKLSDSCGKIRVEEFCHFMIARKRADGLFYLYRITEAEKRVGNWSVRWEEERSSKFYLTYIKPASLVSEKEKEAEYLSGNSSSYVFMEVSDVLIPWL